MGSWIILKELKRRRRKRKSRKEKRRRRSHHHLEDDYADLWHKRRSMKAYSDSDSDVSVLDDSRVGRDKKRYEKKSMKHRHEYD
ncbi:UNVERIFIED_CONTAM: hypothetical protein Sindi_0365200 [Sesamum indicum]